jgi:hypothetical protein
MGRGGLFRLYLALALIGAALPLSAFLPWFADNGLDIPLFIAELFSTRIGAFFGWDVIVSALVLFAFIAVESRRLGIQHWWLPVIATLSIGVSCGLPLFLALRERAVQGRGHER